MSEHWEDEETRVLPRDLGERPPDPERAHVIRAEEEVAGAHGGGWRGVGHLRARKRVGSVRVDEVLARDVERLTTERAPAADDDPGGIQRLPDGSLSIPVYEEELIVTRRVVLRERVVIRKGVETVRQRVRDELRKERVELDVDEGLEDRIVDEAGLTGQARSQSGRRRKAAASALAGTPAAATESRPFFLTSEFVAALAAIAALAIAALVDDALDASLLWPLATAVVVFYLLSRGFAKTRTPSSGHDPRDRLRVLDRGRGR